MGFGMHIAEFGVWERNYKERVGNEEVEGEWI